MRANTEVVRGSTVNFSATFFNPAGVQVFPANAELVVVYRANTGTNTFMTALSSNSGAFAGVFDTSNCVPGPVYWSIKGVGSPNTAVEGSFLVVANPATLVQS